MFKLKQVYTFKKDQLRSDEMYWLNKRFEVIESMYDGDMAKVVLLDNVNAGYKVGTRFHTSINMCELYKGNGKSHLPEWLLKTVKSK